MDMENLNSQENNIEQVAIPVEPIVNTDIVFINAVYEKTKNEIQKVIVNCDPIIIKRKNIATINMTAHGTTF